MDYGTRRKYEQEAELGNSRSWWWIILLLSLMLIILFAILCFWKLCVATSFVFFLSILRIALLSREIEQLHHQYGYCILFFLIN